MQSHKLLRTAGNVAEQPLLTSPQIWSHLQLKITSLIGQENDAEESPAGAASGCLPQAVHQCHPGGGVSSLTELQNSK